MPTPVVVAASPGSGSGSGSAGSAGAATSTASSAPLSSRHRHHRFRQKGAAESLLVPRDRMTRSVTIVPATSAVSTEHLACRTRPRHTD